MFQALHKLLKKNKNNYKIWQFLENFCQTLQALGFEKITLSVKNTKCVLRFRFLPKIAKTFFMHVLGTLCMNCDKLFKKKTQMTKFDKFLEICTIIYKTL